jgi:RNA polymerase sigma-70 factor (ECF subfamily)
MPAGQAGRMTREADEKSLANRAVAGESDAFAEIVRRYQNPVFRICLRYVSRDDAEDAAQETFVRAFVHRERFDPNRPLLPWLMTIAKRICIDRVRKHEPDLDEEIERAPARDPATDAEQTTSTREELRRLEGALAELPEGQREALVLFHMEGMPYKEIATTLGVPVGTIMTWLHRGRARLQSLLEETARKPHPTREAGVSP